MFYKIIGLEIMWRIQNYRKKVMKKRWSITNLLGKIKVTEIILILNKDKNHVITYFIVHKNFRGYLFTFKMKNLRVPKNVHILWNVHIFFGMYTSLPTV